MGSSDLVSIIVPALNESASLGELYDRTHRVLAGVRPFEFIVIDDGSTDGTLEQLEIMREKHPNICILSHFRNHGKSLALMQGFAAARGDVAVTLDADLQDEPEMIPRFLDRIDEGFDLVNGWRQDRRDSVWKVWASRVFNRVTWGVFKCGVHDINCGFKAMRRCVYERLELRGDLHRLIPAIASSSGFRVTELPVSHARRRFGSSRYRLLRHRGLLDVIALAAGSTTQSRPFHIFSEAALFCWLLAAAALAGWAALTVYAPVDSLTYRLAGPLVGLLGVCAVFLGLMLPLVGFQLEMIAGRFQGERWRTGLLKEKLEARVSDYGPRRDPEGVPQERGRQTVLESNAQPLSLLERAADRRLGCPIRPPGGLPAAGGRLWRGQQSAVSSAPEAGPPVDRARFLDREGPPDG